MAHHEGQRRWQDALVARYPDIFNVTEHGGRTYTFGWPSVGDGWRDLVETAVGRIAHAVAAAPSGSLHIVQIKEKFAGLRLYYDSAGLSDEVKSAVEEAVALASARSVCTCEICGEPGRLFKRGGWYLTRCDDHAEGDPVPIRPRRENLHIVRTLDEGRLRILSCRRYIRETDSFVDVDPSELGIEK